MADLSDSAGALGAIPSALLASFERRSYRSLICSRGHCFAVTLKDWLPKAAIRHRRQRVAVSAGLGRALHARRSTQLTATTFIYPLDVN